MRIEKPMASLVPSLRRLWHEAFGDGERFLDCFFGTSFSPDRCRCVTMDGEAVAALYWFDGLCEGRPVAYLYAIATAKTHRGQGLCRTLMAQTHKELSDKGYACALLVPGEPSLFDFYARMGYVPCGSIREFSCVASGEAVALSAMTPAEYAARRRALLPVGGVIQEGESMAFLAAQAELFGGEDFILAARREGDSLFGIELLGNAERAPAILSRLGYTEGRFRTVGEGSPFAMYLPLCEDAPMPTYFGLAFD